MKNETLHQIIARKNESLEQDAINRARDIINEIANIQSAKEAAERTITELQAELKKLEIQQLDAGKILGS